MATAVRLGMVADKNVWQRLFQGAPQRLAKSGYAFFRNRMKK